MSPKGDFRSNPGKVLEFCSPTPPKQDKCIKTLRGRNSSSNGSPRSGSVSTVVSLQMCFEAPGALSLQTCPIEGSASSSRGSHFVQRDCEALTLYGGSEAFCRGLSRFAGVRRFRMWLPLLSWLCLGGLLSLDFKPIGSACVPDKSRPFVDAKRCCGPCLREGTAGSASLPKSILKALFWLRVARCTHLGDPKFHLFAFLDWDWGILDF